MGARYYDPKTGRFLSSDPVRQPLNLYLYAYANGDPINFDGRIRYYEVERPSTYSGRTRGASYVVEYTPSTGRVRGWNECYDRFGNVNRIHPKNINGQEVSSPHYPLTKKELLP